MLAPVLSSKDKAFFIDLSEVTFIYRGEGRDIWFVTPTETHRLVRTIGELESAFEESQFVRIEKNIILNLDRITGYDFKANEVYFDPSGPDQMDHHYVSRENRTLVKNALMFRRR